MGPDAMILVFWMLRFTLSFSFSFTFIKRLVRTSQLSAIRVVSSSCMRLLIFPGWHSFPSLEPVCCSMSSVNCCLLTCMQISQEAGKVVWYSHLLNNFPQFVVNHTVRGFGIVNKAEVDVFLELSCFFDDPTDVGNLISGSSAFSRSNCTSGSLWFMYYWSLTWEILSITLLACEMSTIVW